MDYPAEEFTLTFKTGNEAFSTHAPAEISYILRSVADTIERDGAFSNSGPIIDGNGNRVGQWEYHVELPENPEA